MSDYIPNEIVSQILIRLPVKLILKFKCVCKSWYSLITSPNFISKHTHFTINNNNNNNTHLLLTHYSTIQRRERYTLCDDNESFVMFEEFKFPLHVSNFDNVTTIGFCNGLLCFSYDRENDKKKSNTIFLWNPSIRVSMILPSPCIKMHDTHAVIGFGFDSNTNDYKVVRIVYHQGVHVHAKTAQLPPNKVEVYQLSTGAWRSINGMVQYVVAQHSSQVFLNGAVHWLGYRYTEVKGKLSEVVVVFDICSEVFWEINFPPDCLRFVHLASKGKSLSLIETLESSTRFCIWVMEEYGVVEGWTKQFTIDLSLLIPIGRPLGFRKNGEILLGKSSEALLSYNLKTQEIISFCMDELEAYFCVDIYMESLVLMRRANRVLGQASSCNAVTDKGAPESKVEGSKRLKGA